MWRTEPHHPLACSTMAMGWRDVLNAFRRLPRDEQRLMVKELDLDIYAGLEAWFLGQFSVVMRGPEERDSKKREQTDR